MGIGALSHGYILNFIHNFTDILAFEWNLLHSRGNGNILLHAK